MQLPRELVPVMIEQETRRMHEAEEKERLDAIERQRKEQEIASKVLYSSIGPLCAHIDTTVHC